MSLRLLAAGLLLIALLAPAAQADWGSFHADSRGSGYVEGSTYPIYKDVWWSNKTLANAQVHASPVIKDGVLITADFGSSTATPANSGLVRALDVESGREIWNYRMAAPVEGTPAIDGETVFVVDTAGNLKALNLRDGTCENACPSVVVGPTHSSIVEHEGALFIGTDAGEMKAYLESPLSLLWTFSGSSVYPSATTDSKTGVTTCTGTTLSAQPVIGAPAVYDHQVFFGSLNHYVFAVDEKGGGDGKTTLTWMYKTGDVVLGSPSIVVGSGTSYSVVIGSYDGNVYAFNGITSPTVNSCNGGSATYGTVNSPAWTYPVPSVVDATTGQTQVSKIQSSPANTGDRVFVGANNGHVYALDAATGAQVWEQTAGDSRAPVTGSPAVANGIVVVGSQDKKVYWLSAANGSILKTFETNGAVGPSPAIDGDRAIVTATEGTTYMFGPKMPPRADLVVTSITATAASITVGLKNQGTDAAPATKVRLFLGGSFLADLDVGALAIGASTTVTYTGTIPPGAQTIKASADQDNVVKESTESNNDLTVTITIPAPAPPPAATPVQKVPTTTKKSPAAGLLFGGLLLVCAAMTRRRR